jgi:DnaJ family protein A protein 5
VACNKRFKSEKQFESHERSKKHIKAVQDLRRQMKKETTNLDLDATTVDVPEVSLSEDQELRTARVDEEDYEANEDVVNAEPLHEGQHDTATGNGASPDQNTPEADQSESHSEEEELNQSFHKLNVKSTSDRSAHDNHDEGVQGNSSKQPQKVSADDTKPKIKIGKAKLKRQKKAAAAAATENEVFIISY